MDIMGSCYNKGTANEKGIQQVLIVKKEESANPTEIIGNLVSSYSKLSRSLTYKVSNKERNGNLRIFQRSNDPAIKALMRVNPEKATVEAKNAVISNPDKNSFDITIISTCLKSHFIFHQLTEVQVKEVTKAMKLFTLKANEIVFKEGEPGSNFFIVAQGQLSVSVQGAEVNHLTAGMSFGEGALLQNVPRSASIETLELTKLWGLRREAFCKVVSELNAKNFEENLKIIENLSVFKELNISQKEALVESLVTQRYNPGSYIAREGEEGDLLFIIKEGIASCVKDGQEVYRFTKGDCFGEQALFFKAARNASVVAVNQVECICITNENLTEVLGNRLQVIIYKNTIRNAFKSNSYLKKLSNLQEEILIASMTISEFTPDMIVLPKGTPKQKYLIVVLKGAIKGKTCTFPYLKCIGEVELITNSEETWQENIIAAVDCTLGFISKQLFESAIGGSYNENVGNNGKIRLLKNIPLFRTLTTNQYTTIIQALKLEEFHDKQLVFKETDPGGSLFIIKSGTVDVFKKGNYIRSIEKNNYFGERSILFSSPRSATVIANGPLIVWVLQRSHFLAAITDKLYTSLIKRIDLQDDSVQLSDLKLVKLLGRGLTGIVYLAVHKEKKTLYALKTVSRQKIATYCMYENIRLERTILLHLDHVFIMKLVKTFKDETRIYFLTEYVRGMDLFEVMRKMKFISEIDAKFFIGSLIIILEKLRGKEIVYRDLKPENVVVDDEGYLKMIDMGTAKFLKGRTFTLLGTPQYMAPEVIKRTGYNFSADYWSLGIIMFEILFGYLPFGEDDRDPMAVYEKVLGRELTFPTKPQGNCVDARELIDQLLSVNPASRIGGSFEVLKSHSWFSGFAWELLESKQMSPPYVPEVIELEEDIESAIDRKQNMDLIISSEENESFAADQAKQNDWDRDF